jgi:hypothetical protein
MEEETHSIVERFGDAEGAVAAFMGKNPDSSHYHSC